MQKISHKDSWVQTPDGRLFVRIWSPVKTVNESPIVLFHDSLGCVELWRSFPALLCANTRRTVIAYDRLGFGKSDAHPTKLDLDFITDEVETGFTAVRQQLGFDQFGIFGHSVGGCMAIHCAASYKNTCDAVATEATIIFVEKKTIQAVKKAREFFKQKKPIERLKSYHGDKTKWILDAWFNTWLSPEFATWSQVGILPRIKSPMLVLHGMEDEYGSMRHPELIEQHAGGPVRVEILPDTYHVPHREKERDVVDIFANFIRSIDEQT